MRFLVDFCSDEFYQGFLSLSAEDLSLKQCILHLGSNNEQIEKVPVYCICPNLLFSCPTMISTDMATSGSIVVGISFS